MANIKDVKVLESFDIDLYGILPQKFKDNICKIDETIMAMDEDEFLKIYTPSKTDRLLRINMWLEYNRYCFVFSKKGSATIDTKRIWKGVCSSQTFYSRMEDPFVLAYILKPPVEYKIQLEYLLDRSMKKIEDLLELDPYNDDGTVNINLVKMQASLATNIREAARGLAVQKTMIVNKSLDAPAIESHEELDRRIKELEDRARVNKVITVNSSDVTDE